MTDGILAPLPEPDASPTVCLEVNQEWLPAILGLLYSLKWRKTWQGDDADIELTRRRADKLLVLFSQGNCMVSPQFRQNPQNDCVFQASYDDGMTWVDIFDYALCQPDPPIIQTTVSPQFRQSTSDDCILEASYNGGTTWQSVFNFGLCVPRQSIAEQTIQYIEVENIYNETINNITNNYDGTPGSVAPDMDYDSSGDDVYRDDVLCHAARILVEYAAEVGIKVAEEADNFLDNQLNISAAALGIATVVAAAATAIIGTAAAPFTLGASLTIAFPALGAAIALIPLITEADVDAFNNETAKEEVACCFYNNIKGQNPSQAIFQNGLNGCAFTGDAQKIADVLSVLLQDFNTYLTFLDICQQIYQAVSLGSTRGCFCDCQETAFTRLQDDEPGVTVEAINQTQFFPTQDSNVSTILSNSVTFNLGGTFRITRFQIKHFVGVNPEQYWQEWEVIIGTETLVMKHVDLDESFELPFVETLRPQEGITQITINKTVGGNNFSWDWIRFDYCTE